MWENMRKQAHTAFVVDYLLMIKRAITSSLKVLLFYSVKNIGFLPNNVLLFFTVSIL